MSRPVVLGLVLLIGALVLLVPLLTPAGRGGLDGLVPEARPEEAAEPSRSPELLRAEGSGDELAQFVSSDAEPDSEKNTTLPIQREAPDERPRISGTVWVPGGIPAGEIVKVRAEVFPKSGRGSQELVTRVASDGSFTLTVPEDTKHAELGLDSRFLALDGAVKARPGDTGVELTPLAYATIEGEVVPPQPPSTPGVTWADMEVSWSSGFRPDRSSEQVLTEMLSPSCDKPVQPDSGGAFVLSFVPVGVEFELHAENPFGPEWIQRIEPLAPAERRRIAIALELGITISGRVLDQQGQPVAGVHVSTDDPEPTGVRWPRWRTEPRSTDAEGRFVLAHSPRRVTTLVADGVDLAQSTAAIVDGTSGDVNGVVLSVVRGGCIEGTVVWADRRPVEFFTIRVSSEEEGHRSETCQEGRFRLPGLGEGLYRVEVRAKGDGVVGTACALDVQAGAPPLAFVLAEVRAFEARGKVVDREGAPVPRFRVSATGPPPERRCESADGYDGRLLLIGLLPGEWNFEVSATGYQLARQQVVMGEGTPPLRFELLTAGRIRGRVVDAAGAPVAGAWVGDPGASFAAIAAEYVEVGHPGSTDAEGRFEIEATTTSVRLQARRRGFAPSPVVELEVASGASVEGIVLNLGEACRVEGRVLDARGDPVIGATVSTVLSTGRAYRTDTQGAFAIDGLSPGPVSLLAYCLGMEGALASSTVTLVPGQTSSVELRFEAPDPVRVRGRITRGGQPVACHLQLRSRSFAIDCASGADGRFDVTLQQPGEWSGIVWLGSDPSAWIDPVGNDVRRFRVTVPDTDEHALELVLDTLPRLTSMEEFLR